MLTSLHIENIAVIKSVDIDFSKGFSAFTGETGAGKSIIIDSINLLLGRKPDRDLIRRGEDFAFVSGLFSSLPDSTLEAFSSIGVEPDEDGNLLIQRKLCADGKSQVKINGRSVSLTVLRSATEKLINIHGQKDTHTLTSSENHIKILDMFIGNSDLISEYSSAYDEYDTICKDIKHIAQKEQERHRYTEILEYQIADIDSLSLYDGEEEELIEKKLKIKNSEKILKHTGFAYKALKGSEKGSVSYLIERSASSLQAIADVIPAFSEYADRLRDCLYQIDDISEEVLAVLEDGDEDPVEKLNEIESRLDKISKIKRKYGLTIKAVLEFRDKAFEELNLLKNSEDYMNELIKKRDIAYSKALKIADKLHIERIEKGKILEKSVASTLEFLDMPKVVFYADIKENIESGEKKLNALGYDTVEFFISANKGLVAQAIEKIASGGELARIMLAIKSVIADKDGISTIIFDEIDAGVSGKTARKIGLKMQELASTTQLFAVTHSAQIASLADTHFLIKKSENNGSTETDVAPLDRDGRITELSRILGGIKVTEAQRAAALDMLKEKELYKKA